MASSKWFDEKAIQVDPAAFSAFGIGVDSRYGKAWELTEMLAFCDGIAELGYESLISSVFYDSKANLCSFEAAAGAHITPSQDEAMLAVALTRITQFVWLDDCVYHKKGYED